MRKAGQVVRAVAVGIAILGLGVWIGRGWDVAEALDVDLYRWFSDWSRTAGFGGAAAIVAATIAYFAATQNARRQERADRKAQWWARAQWALDLTLHKDEHAQEVGFRVLAALSESEWAGEHEAGVIAAATGPALESEPSTEPAAEQAALRDRPEGLDASDSEQEV